MTSRVKAKESQRGFALPFTLFLVTLITLMLAVSFTRSSTEVNIADSSDATVLAHAIAQGGLGAYLSDTMSARPSPTDSFRYNQPGGYAWVKPGELQKHQDTLANPIVYVIRSRGIVIDPLLGSAPQAEATVVQMARWQSGGMTVTGLFTSDAGIERVSGAFTVEAWDHCAAGLADIYQLLAPPTLPSITGGASGLGSSSNAALRASVYNGIDWASVTNGSFPADYYSIQLNDTTFPSQLVYGNATIAGPDNGSGLLMVTGSLRITSSVTQTSGEDVDWDGVILVGDNLVSTANFFDVNGVIITGLNAMFGAVRPDTLAGGDADFVYDSCNVDRSLSRLKGFLPVSRSWANNWATY
jgi:hypothetical protein